MKARLPRYIARPALSNERISVNDRGQVVYRLKHPFRDDFGGRVGDRLLDQGSRSSMRFALSEGRGVWHISRWRRPPVS